MGEIKRMVRLGNRLNRGKVQRKRISASRARLLFVLAAAMLAFLMLIIQLFSVSVWNGKKWADKAMRQWSRTTYLKADRGKITDRDGTELASSYTTYQVCVNPQNIQMDDRERIAYILSTYLQMDYDTVLAKMSKTRIKRGTENSSEPEYVLLSQVKIKDQVDKEVISQLNAMQLGTGVSYYADVKRDYPESGYYAQLLGFTNVDGDGQTGVELTCNSYLSGEDGYLKTDTDRDNNPVPGGDEEYVMPIAGGNVRLTTNTGLQAILENALEEACTVNNSATAYGILMNPQTGEIYAEGSYPTFESANPPRSDAKVLLELSKNRIVTDTYEPGTSFGIITIASALESGAISMNTMFNCSGSLLVKGERIKCLTTKGHKTESLSEALTNNCKTAFMSMALRMGLDTFYDYIYSFGFNDTTGSGIMGETSGKVTHKKYVRDADLAEIGYGRNITSTGMQLTMAVTAAINGGDLLKPYVIYDITDNDGNIIQQGKRTVLRRVISPATSELVRTLMQYIVDNGDGRGAQVYGYTVGGKTGASQKYDEDGKPTGSWIASFIGFAPVNDPQFICLIVIDDPQVPSSYVNYVAAPYVQEVLASSLSLRGIPSDRSNVSETVPNVVGMTVDEAVRTLKANGLNAIYLEGEANSLVTAQAPRNNMTVVHGSNVILYSNGYTFFNSEVAEETEMVKVPDLYDKGKVDRIMARDALEAVGLVMDYDPENCVGYVVGQSYPEGTQVPIGTVVFVQFQPED